MKRDTQARLGCDSCKLNTPTYRFTHHEDIDLWLCDTCLAPLLEWPDEEELQVHRANHLTLTYPCGTQATGIAVPHVCPIHENCTVDELAALQQTMARLEEELNYATTQVSFVVKELNTAIDSRKVSDGDATEELRGMLHEWEHWLAVDWDEFIRFHNAPPSTEMTR